MPSLPLFCLQTPLRLPQNLDSLRKQRVTNDETVATHPFANVSVESTVVIGWSILSPQHKTLTSCFQQHRLSLALGSGTEWATHHVSGQAIDPLRLVAVAHYLSL
jgi:regulation of enolase protein 1 (concanavalin A-like superfamily)